MLEPLTEHQLLVFWVQLAVLVAVARGLGGLCRRAGQPAVVGELAAGLILGPSLLGRVAPDAFAWLLPPDPVQGGMLLAVSWIGVGLLLVIAGFETDLKLLTSLGRGSVTVSLGSLLVPLAGGIALGLALPDGFVGGGPGDVATPPGDLRLEFALFFGVALAVSALPVVAKILMDMNLMRRDVGQVTIAAGIANDIVGYVALGVLAGVVTTGGFDPVELTRKVVLVVAFGVLALTLGRRLVDRALRYARRESGSNARSFTVLVVTVLVCGAVTQWIGVEAVLGTFVAGIVLGGSRYLKEDVRHGFEGVVGAFFAPVFFATAGLSVDLGLLLDPEVAIWTLVAVAVAAATKVVGAAAGALAGGMGARSGVAIGVGLNARGAIGVIVGAIALGLGVLNAASYTVVVVISIATSLMAPPLLRLALRGLAPSATETVRLEREETLERSVVAKTRAALLPTRGGVNSVLAGRLLDLALQPEATVTVVTAHPPGDRDARDRVEPAVRALRDALKGRDVDRHDRNTDDPVRAILDEAALGYGLVAVGMTETLADGRAASPTLGALLARCPVPVLLVRHGRDVDGTDLDPGRPLPFRRILVPAPGTAVGRAAQEVAFVIAGRLDAEVDVVHVVTRPDKEPVLAVAEGATAAVGSLTQAESLASRFGRAVNLTTRAGTAVGPELAAMAAEHDSDLIVVGGQLRSFDGQPFPGHNVEYLLEHTDRTVVAVLFPAGGDGGAGEG